MRYIDWSWPCHKIHNWVRGLSPYPSMYTTFNGKILKVFKTFVENGPKCRPGVVFQINNDSILVGTGDGLLGLLEIQLEGKKKLFIKDFLKGNPIREEFNFWKMKSDYRFLAYKILHQFEKKDDSILDIRNMILSKIPDNRNLRYRTTVLVNEVIRYKGRLDLMITFISGKKIKYLNKKVLTILRIGFYEIFFDSKVPDYAAVDSSVRLANKVTNKKTKGFTNAVLRKLIRYNKENNNWLKN